MDQFVNSTANPPVPSESEITRWMSLFQQRRFHEVERLALDATSKFPGYCFAWTLLGASRKEQGRIQEAIEPMRKAAELAPHAEDSHNNLGIVLHDVGRYQEAEGSFRQALMINADSGLAWSNLGLSLHSQSRFTEAEGCLRQALAFQPDAGETWNNLGTSLRELGKLSEAIECYQRAISINPSPIAFQNNLANALFLSGRSDEAAELYLRVLEMPVMNAADRQWKTSANFGLSTILDRQVPLWHLAMMNDDHRNEAYYQALRMAVTPETQALEIGTGSGLLAMMTAKLGARQVVTCEAVPLIASTAKAIVEDNLMSSTIRVVSKKSQDLEMGVDMPRRANLLVSEIFSSELLGEGVLPSIEDAKKRLLDADAAIIPARASIVFAVFASREVQSNIFVDHVHGFDLRRFNRIVARKNAFHRQDLELEFATDPTEAFTFDFVNQSNFPPESKRIELTVRQSARCFGIIQWIRLYMNDSIVFENNPADRSMASGWQHCVYRFYKPLDVQLGETLAIYATHDRNSVWLELDT